MWLTATALAPSPVPPAAAGLVAGGAVLLLPRLGWVALAVALAVLAVSQHLPGAAVVIAMAFLLPLVISPAAATTWPLSAGAPALGLIGLAGAWPAVAARATTPWRRATLGAVGWIWVLLASAVAGKALYLPLVPGVAPPHAWMSSLTNTIDHLLRPEVSAGVLAPALVWALGAVTLPWLVRGGSLVLDVVRVVVLGGARGVRHRGGGRRRPRLGGRGRGLRSQCAGRGGGLRRRRSGPLAAQAMWREPLRSAGPRARVS